MHSPSGVRRVELARPDGRVVVAMGHGGYVQRPMVFQGHAFVQRTYLVNGVAYPRVYRSATYGGRQYSIYQPIHYYRPEYYAWAGRPWAQPVAYQWGWETQSWSQYYGGYYRPYPSYAGPAFWLTDFVVSTTLAEAYLAHAGAPPLAGGLPIVMLDDARFAITREVQRQMGQESTEQAMVASLYGPGAASAPPPIFAPNGPKAFLVSSEVMAYAGGVEVPLSEGAVLQLSAPPPAGAEFAQVQVMANRDPACPRGSYVFVSTNDLQEMHNHLQGAVDQGLERMQGQGLGAIPAPPPQAVGTMKPAYANLVQPETTAVNDISLAVREADQAEQGMGTL